MYEYTHGGNADFEKNGGRFIDLSANINPLGMPEGVRDAVIRAIAGCGRYPDSFSGKLREKIAEFESVKPEWIFCGGGASDIIFRLPRAARAKKALVTAPAFSDYERAAASCGAEIVRHALSAARGFSVGRDFIETARREKPDMVFICNPNNPTGKLAETGLVGELLALCRSTGCRVIVDECFLDFAENAGRYTSKVFLEEYPNVVILKAFTKVFALPGIRLGYALCADKEFAQNLYFHGADWPVSNLAQAAGLAALDEAENYIRKTVEYVSAERKAMESELGRLGYTVFGSQANYVFLQNPYRFDLREELDKMGIRVRACGNFYGLDNSYCRIAVAEKEINAKLLSAVQTVTKKERG